VARSELVHMGFHLQLYPPKLSAWVIVLLVLFLPATLTVYFLRNLVWLVVVPFVIIVLVLFIAAEAKKAMLRCLHRLGGSVDRFSTYVANFGGLWCILSHRFFPLSFYGTSRE
jgi:hypothetical protein